MLTITTLYTVFSAIVKYTIAPPWSFSDSYSGSMAFNEDIEIKLTTRRVTGESGWQRLWAWLLATEEEIQAMSSVDESDGPETKSTTRELDSEGIQTPGAYQESDPDQGAFSDKS